MDHISPTHTVADVIAVWPSITEAARAISIASVAIGGSGLSAGAVKQWVRRGSIPAHYFLAVVDARRCIGTPITCEDLARISLSMRHSDGDDLAASSGIHAALARVEPVLEAVDRVAPDEDPRLAKETE
jgi:hypothetical protein